MVWAFWPVSSDMRLAARPVGAQRDTRCPECCKSERMAFTVVVLPVPGPPVSTITLLLMAMRMALRCSSA